MSANCHRSERHNATPWPPIRFAGGGVAARLLEWLPSLWIGQLRRGLR